MPTRKAAHQPHPYLGLQPWALCQQLEPRCESSTAGRCGSMGHSGASVNQAFTPHVSTIWPSYQKQEALYNFKTLCFRRL